MGNLPIYVVVRLSIQDIVWNLWGEKTSLLRSALKVALSFFFIKTLFMYERE